MHVGSFLHKQLSTFQPAMHEKRLFALNKAVLGLLNSGVLQLTAIGRSLPTQTSDKHAIKCVDRLLGNVELSRERIDLYRYLTHQIVHRQNPVILIDYSDVDALRRRVILRASLALRGRSLVVYEEVHDHDNYRPYWERFLATLKSILPLHCRPIIVTDAGFRGPWRKVIKEMNWYYVMRQRNRDLVRFSTQNTWFPCKALYGLATSTPKYLGQMELHRAAPDLVDIYAYHRPSRKRNKLTKRGQRALSKHSNKNADREREPWLLLSNLPKTVNMAKKVVSLYESRMQIEESFRDLKSHRFGLAFRGTLCNDRLRLQNLLLIAALATFIIWVLGLFAEKKLWHTKMQANTEKKRRVLSTLTIGLNAYRKRINLLFNDWLNSISQLRELALVYC